MIARTMLAALDNNNNTNRQQARVATGPRKGQLRYDVVFPKGRKCWIAKPIYESKSYSYITEMLHSLLQQCGSGPQKWTDGDQVEIPPNIATVPKPPNETVINNLKRTRKFPDSSDKFHNQ